MTCLFNRNKLDLKDQVRVGRDKRGMGGSNRLVAVGKVAGNVEHRLLADLHLRNGLVPAFDETANTNGRIERLATVKGGIKLGAPRLRLGRVLDPTGVVHADDLALVGLRTGALGNDGLLNTHFDCDGSCSL